MKFRYLRAEDIDCRVQSISKDKSGLTMLLYKDARCDMNILDETVGPENWQREHYECKGNLFCRVGICCKMNVDESGNEGDILSPSWVWKSDCGTESNTDAEKGEASDSFKRACFNWGIGRELYTAPFIWVTSESFTLTNDGKCKNKFVVTHLKVEDGKIVELKIYNKTLKKECFSFGCKKSDTEFTTASKVYATNEQMDELLKLADDKGKLDTIKSWLENKNYKITIDQYKKTVAKLK